jgi:hypothetical protein
MPLIKRVKFYVRHSLAEPTFSQDYPTFIMHGKSDHLYFPAFKAWFIIVPATENIEFLKRDSGKIYPSSWRIFLEQSGRRAYLELFEDQAGFRFKRLAQFIRRKIPILKKIKWLKRIAQLDENTFEWDRKAQRPIPGRGMTEG